MKNKEKVEAKDRTVRETEREREIDCLPTYTLAAGDVHMQNVFTRTISLSNRFESIVVQYVSLGGIPSPYSMKLANVR